MENAAKPNPPKPSVSIAQLKASGVKAAMLGKWAIIGLASAKQRDYENQRGGKDERPS